jgi:carbon storage regulator
MLVLSRKRDEEIVIVSDSAPDQIIARISLVDVRGDKVRLGFTADNSIKIYRREVYDEIRRNAARPQPA